MDRTFRPRAYALTLGAWGLFVLAGMGLPAYAALPSGLTDVTLTDTPTAIPCSSGTCTYDASPYSGTSNYSTGHFLGAENFADTGVSIVSADFDNDGNPDIAVGAPKADVGGNTDRGAVYVWYGTGKSSSAWSGQLLLSNAIILAGKVINSNLGQSIAVADLTGDGKKDLIIGAPGYEATGQEGGRVYVVPGGTSRWTSQTSANGVEAMSGVFSIYGAGTSGAQLGYSLSTGDAGADNNACTVTSTTTDCVQGDGYTDLLIGAPGASLAYLVWSRGLGASGLTTTLNLASSSPTNVFKFTGTAGERMGHAVGLVPSLDGSIGDYMEADIVIGAPDFSSKQGRIWLIRGRSRKGLETVFGSAVGDLTTGGGNLPTDVRRIEGDLNFNGTKSGSFGWALAGIGDIDGDTIQDLAIGAPTAPKDSLSYPEAGRVYIVRGMTSVFSSGSVVLSAAGYPFFYGISNYDHVGYSVSAGGKVDNLRDVDDYGDFLVGARRLDTSGSNDYGGAYLVVGSAASNWSFTAKAITTGLAFRGPNSADAAGTAVLGGLNLDGDSYDDFIITSPGSTQGNNDQQGRLYIIGFGDFMGRDGDGQSRTQGDCDDSDAQVYYRTGGEICDGKDNNCNGKVDAADSGLTGTVYYTDGDGDGYGDSRASASCSSSGAVTNNTDCDDGDSAKNPGKTEICDGKDNDCDTLVDDADGTVTGQTTYYEDQDSDTYGNSSKSKLACSKPTGYVTNSTDCDDTDPARYPNNTEICDGKDNDCDFQTDDGDSSITGQPTYYLDADADTYGRDATTTKTCQGAPSGYVNRGGDCNDLIPTINPGATETCDSVDNDCDTFIDDADSSVSGQPTWYRDNDSDTYGSSTNTQKKCSQPSGYVSNSQDCDDNNAAIKPGATEVCDSKDNDCDTFVDDADSPVSGQSTWYDDDDGDTYGDSKDTQSRCAQPTGYVSNSLDCDDTSAAVNPGATETCDNGIDNDCDNVADDNDTGTTGKSTFYRDADSDTYGVEALTTQACKMPTGYASRAGDCDDSSAKTYPGAPEWKLDQGQPVENASLGCFEGDTYDNDCDLTIDEGTCKYDDDQDGFSEEAGDCDDANPNKFPGNLELCNGQDEDCDEQVDEDYDDDFDGQLDATLCNGAVVGTDCDDSDPNVYEGAEPLCDGKDTDCDGSNTDTGIASEADSDKDGHRICDAQCEDGEAQPCIDDCDDTKPSVYEGAAELCDGIDNNCNTIVDTDGQVDEDQDGQNQCDGDCDDSNPDIYLGATEVCDGLDNDCTSGIPANESDADKDGFRLCEDDCNDGNDEVFPGADEVCDDIDNDCENGIDVDALDEEIYYQDSDGDRHGNESVQVQACEAPAGYVTSRDDCDDLDGSIYTGAAPFCDGLDHDCDGKADYTVADFDLDNDDFLSAEVCSNLPADYKLDCDDDNNKINPGAAEVANDGVDNNCDGNFAVDDFVAEVLTGGCSCQLPASGSSSGPSGGTSAAALLILIALRLAHQRRQRLSGPASPESSLEEAK